MIIVIAILATIMLFVYERSAITPVVGAQAIHSAFCPGCGRRRCVDRTGVRPRDGWLDAAAVLTETMPPATDAAFWMLMQIGIVLGVVTGYPVVRRLQRHRSTPA